MSAFQSSNSLLERDLEQSTFAARSHYEKIRAKRVSQITLAVICALLSVAFIQFREGIYHEVAILVGVTVLCFGVLYWSRLGKVKEASTGIVVLLTVMAAVMAAAGGGLRDVVLYAFPGLIIISAMLISPRRTLILIILIVAYLLTMGYGIEQGWWQHKTERTGLATALILSIILIVIGFSIYALHMDLVRMLAKIQDENKRYIETRQRIQHIALHDALTGLPNRRLARERFKNLFDLSKRREDKIALLFIDLDEFKIVNDSSGHEAGDRMLQVVGERLQENLRESDTVCRLGGDEFLVIANEVGDEQELGRLADKLIATISEPVKIFDMEHSCSASIGITVSPQDGQDFDALLKNADMAMYLAKKEGRNNYQYFDERLQQDANRKVELVSHMRSAIPENEFSLLYQPKIRLSDNRVIGAEALIRWNSETHGAVAPNELIPLAESSGFIHDLGFWVIAEACKDLRYMQSQGFEDFHFSINVSIAQLQNQALRTRFAEILDQYGLDPEAIDLELTETLLANDHSQLSENLDRLREIGMSLSIDDFGTGYSNLGYLKRFDVETLKIDRSFVQDLPQNTNNQAIVRAILQICEELGMRSVAEGVEDSATMEYLRHIGCDSAQGYFWSKPLPLQELMEFLTNRGAPDQSPAPQTPKEQ